MAKIKWDSSSSKSKHIASIAQSDRTLFLFLEYVKNCGVSFIVSSNVREAYENAHVCAIVGLMEIREISRFYSEIVSFVSFFFSKPRCDVFSCSLRAKKKPIIYGSFS